MSWVSRILQSLVLTCLTSDSVRQLLSDAKHNCASRREMLKVALAQQGIATNPNTDGLNVWISVSHDCRAVAYELSKKGWLVRPGTSI